MKFFFILALSTVVFLGTLLSNVKASSKYFYCWGEKRNGQRFCSSHSKEKYGINFCKKWSKNRFKDSIKWGERSITTNSQPDSRRYYKWCGRYHNIPSVIKGPRSFYIGCVDKNGLSDIINIKLSSKQFDEKIFIDYASSGSISCFCKKHHILFNLYGGNNFDRPSFVIENESTLEGEAKDLPIFIKKFQLTYKSGNSQCFAMSSQVYNKSIYKKEGIRSLNVKKMLLGEYYDSMKLKGFDCSYGQEWLSYDWD